ncbi:MAG: transporter substrate-binding domain-containing protein [Desulfamplus sp.]|nr:transporter substrate-binding domain-containing protein [Desulfamplus sp.]
MASIINAKRIIIIILIIMLYLPSVARSTVPESLGSHLTEHEKEFLAKTGVVKVHNETDWAPFNFNENGTPKGFSVDYMKLLAQKTGLEISFVNGPSWDQFLDMMKKGEIDIMLNIAKSPERQKFLEFTPSYVSMVQMLYTRTDFPTVSSVKDLYGKRFAVPKGFFLQDVLSAHPQIELFEVPDTSAAIRAVSVGKADALFDLMPVVDYITSKLQITNLKVGGDLELEESKPIPLHIAVRKEMKILADILEKGMATITEEELHELHVKWLTGSDWSYNREEDSTSDENANIILTREERQFIQDNIADREIRLGVDSARPPFEYIDEKGVYAGISADFITVAAARIGISVIPQKDVKWTEAMEKVKVGEIDVIPKVTPSAARKKFMNFTRPYTTFPSVIVSRKDQLAGGLEDLRGLKVGVIKGQIIEANLKRDRAELQLLTSPDIKTALTELSNGKFDVFIDNLGAVAYTIDTLGLVNLRIAASTPYNHDLAFGVRKDWPLLASALDKSLAAMTDQEKAEIKSRWLAIKYQKGVDWWVVGPISVVLLGITIFVLIWNRRLGRAMRDREHAERKIKAMGQAMADALVMVNSQGRVMFWNQAAEKLFGYSVEEAMGRDFHDMAVPAEVRDNAHAGIRQFALSGEGAVFGSTISTVAIKRSGETFPVEVSLSPFQVEGEWFAVGSVRDITDRKQVEKEREETQARLQYILDTSPVGVAFSSRDRIRFANPRFKEMFGLDVGDSSSDLYVDPNERSRLMEKIKSEGKVENYELQMYNKSREIIEILITDLPMKYGEDEGVLGWFMDITERKKAQNAVQDSEKQHRTIFENSPLGMIHMSVEGTILNCNEKFVELMGSSREKLIGFNSLRQGRDVEMKTALQKAISGEPAEYEADYTSATGGKTVPLNMKFSPVNSGHNPTEVIVTLEDVTERKQAEKQLKSQMEDLAQFSRLTINREERMIELKEEINSLMEQLGKGQKYKIVE